VIPYSLKIIFAAVLTFAGITGYKLHKAYFFHSTQHLTAVHTRETIKQFIPESTPHLIAEDVELQTRDDIDAENQSKLERQINTRIDRDIATYLAASAEKRLEMENFQLFRLKTLTAFLKSHDQQLIFVNTATETALPSFPPSLLDCVQAINTLNNAFATLEEITAQPAIINLFYKHLPTKFGESVGQKGSTAFYHFLVETGNPELGSIPYFLISIKKARQLFKFIAEISIISCIKAHLSHEFSTNEKDKIIKQLKNAEVENTLNLSSYEMNFQKIYQKAPEHNVYDASRDKNADRYMLLIRAGMTPPHQPY